MKFEKEVMQNLAMVTQLWDFYAGSDHSLRIRRPLAG